MQTPPRFRLGFQGESQGESPRLDRLLAIECVFEGDEEEEEGQEKEEEGQKEKEEGRALTPISQD